MAPPTIVTFKGVTKLFRSCLPKCQSYMSAKAVISHIACYWKDKLPGYYPSSHMAFLKSNQGQVSKLKKERRITKSVAVCNLCILVLTMGPLLCNKERCVFVLSWVWEKKKFWVPMRNWTSDFQIPHSDALPLSLKDSMVSKVYYEVHMTCVLHIARISNVSNVMFVDRNYRDGKFSAW